MPGRELRRQPLQWGGELQVPQQAVERGLVHGRSLTTRIEKLRAKIDEPPGFFP